MWGRANGFLQATKEDQTTGTQSRPGCRDNPRLGFDKALFKVFLGCCPEGGILPVVSHESSIARKNKEKEVSMFRHLLTISAVYFLAYVPHVAAQATTPVDVYGGYIFSSFSPDQNFNRLNSNGWGAGITYYPTYRFGIAADFAGTYDSGLHLADSVTGAPPSGLPSTTIHDYSFLFGPQIRLSNRKIITSSFRMLFGVADGGANPAMNPSFAGNYSQLNATVFAASFGGAVDINISKRVAWRVQPDIYLTTFGPNIQRNFRLFTGPVFRIGHVQEQ